MTTAVAHLSLASLSQQSLPRNLPLPPSGPSSRPQSFYSVSSSDGANDDGEDVTITFDRSLKKGKQRSSEDLRLLAVSVQMTEISYSISDCQTRIFEIQELRHQDIGSASGSQSSSEMSSTSSTTIIDQALLQLDEKLASVAKSIAAIEERLEPVLRAVKTPTQDFTPVDDNEDVVILRKHAALMNEWEAVQSEAHVLRDELKEDKWLVVFRNASEQADGMMSSLEKALRNCQDFIWQAHGGPVTGLNSLSSSVSSNQSDHSPISLEVFNELQKSFEAKKKYYMPATTKVLSVLDKGVRDRVTKNGECLRRHGDMRARWKALQERIARTDAEMDAIYRNLTEAEVEPSEDGSTVSRGTNKSRSNGTVKSSRTSSSISRSISQFAAKITGKSGPNRSFQTPPKGATNGNVIRAPASDPAPTLRSRMSLFPPARPTPLSSPSYKQHKSQTSLQLPSPSSKPGALPSPALTAPGGFSDENNATVKAKKPRWNASTRDDGTPAPPLPPIRRRPSQGILNVAAGPPSAGTAVGNPRAKTPGLPTTPSKPPTIKPRTSPPSATRPQSRSASRAGSRAQSPFGLGATARPRPETPSQIPAPSFMRGLNGPTSEADLSEYQSLINSMSSEGTSLMQRALSPTIGASPNRTPIRKARRPSESRIPLPRFNFSAASRPTSPTTTSQSPQRSISPSLSTASSAVGPQTPESAQRPRGQVPPVPPVPQFPSSRTPRPGARPSIFSSVGPPSSYKDASGSVSSSSRPPSRSASRNGDRSITPSLADRPQIPYIPASLKDPLDVEVAQIANSVPHGFLIERMDPPLRTAPPPGMEVKAQYAFSNALGRKIINCKLVVVHRSGSKSVHGEGPSKKVMCRVGGGWQDLELYIMNRQAGSAV